MLLFRRLPLTRGTFVGLTSPSSKGCSNRWATASSTPSTTQERYDLDVSSSSAKGRVLVLGGTGFLGQMVCKRAVLRGYSVVSLSRRGLPPGPSGNGAVDTGTTEIGSDEVATRQKIDYRSGDARQKQTIADILQEGGFVGVVHCVGLLFDDASGLGSYNRLASGSGSVPDSGATYDAITRLTAFNAIEAATEYAQRHPQQEPFPFVFTSAAEAGWPDMAGGTFVEERLAPDFLRRYLVAKRAVESRLLSSSASVLRPVIVRPSLIYSWDRPASFVPVGAFFVGNALGLPFVDRPVTVQSLAAAMVRSLERSSVKGILRYPEIDQLSS